jgi:DNA-binding MarR family transcriptional regulator
MPDDPPGGDLRPISELDRVIHEPARLLVMATLYVVDSADYTFLKGQTGLTWGNLSSHLTKLEEAGYVEVEKKFKGRKPNTMLRLTAEGRAAFRAYRRTVLDALGDLPD